MIETRWWNPKYLKKTIFDFIRTKQNSVYSVHGTAGLKLLTRITLSSSHLNEHKFQHSLRNTVNPTCRCSIDPETTEYYLLQCKLYNGLRLELLNNIYFINQSLKIRLVLVRLVQDKTSTFPTIWLWKIYVR